MKRMLPKIWHTPMLNLKIYIKKNICCRGTIVVLFSLIFLFSFSILFYFYLNSLYIIDEGEVYVSQRSVLKLINHSILFQCMIFRVRESRRSLTNLQSGNSIYASFFLLCLILYLRIRL